MVTDHLTTLPGAGFEPGDRVWLTTEGLPRARGVVWRVWPDGKVQLKLDRGLVLNAVEAAAVEKAEADSGRDGL